ncbi:hypothetical protein EDB19DRAFT_1613963, partial [Suillus lakei]
ECKKQMVQYMNCLRKNSSAFTPCRAMNKQTLCLGLMERHGDEWKNIRLANLEGDSAE